MDEEELRQVIKTIVQQSPYGYKKSISVYRDQLKSYVDLESKMYKEYLYLFIHHMSGPPRCEVCTASAKFRNITYGYGKTCSPRCSGLIGAKGQKTRDKKSHQQSTEKRKATNLVKYGVETPLQNKTIKEKQEQTMIDKYGVRYAVQSPELIDQYKEICLEKYGVDNPLKLPEVQEKMTKSFVTKYGYRSKEEIACLKEIDDFVGSNLESTNKILNGKQLDGYDSQLEFAIEYCGLFHHSDNPSPKANKHKQYHYEKWKICYEKNIKLFTIYSDEWKYNKDKIKRYIYMNLGLAKTKIFARKCIFREISKKEANDFCNLHHLQGGTPNILKAFGLFYDNNLVQMMSFGYHHRNSKTIVLNRMCGEFDIQVIGGASKLIKNAHKILQCPIVTWSNNRWSNGNVYQKAGFKLDRYLPPDYEWTNHTARFSKQSRRKSVTKQPVHMTETEYNKMLNLDKIYDCGKIRWIYE